MTLSIFKAKMKPLYGSGLLIILFTLILSGCAGPSSKLESGFKNPPESAKPRVWWHWMNGNISKEGIKADLLWMKRTGIAGFQNFDAGLASPQIVPKRLIYMTPEWKDAFLFTTHLVDSLDLEMAIAGSPGWSESGGPWVPPSQAMKKIVWSEIRIKGGTPFTGTVPQPPSSTGRFQNIGGGYTVRDPSQSVPEFYADAAVVAFKTPQKDVSITDLNPQVTSSAGRFDLASLVNGDYAAVTFLPVKKPGEKAWIQFEFKQPETISSLAIVTSETGLRIPGFGGGRTRRYLEKSDNGRQFEIVFEISGGESAQNTLTFAPVTARFFRITFQTPVPQNNSELIRMFGGLIPSQPQVKPGINVAEINLYPAARINHFEDKAGFSAATGLYDLVTRPADATEVINKSDVVDLTSKMKNDGTLEWTPPEGNWTILRLGYSLTGHQNSPASPEATGLEVDKLNAGYVKSYFDNYLDQYKDATGGMMGDRGLKYVITDSWEAGVQNWTDSMMIEFAKHRKYDMLPWLPALAGHIVESAEASDRFLWDFRKTIGDLTAEKHYDQLTEILKTRKMARYTESHESGRAFIGDGMDVKRKAAIPMSATWVPGGFAGSENQGVATRFKADVRESASVAHIYGQNLVAAESMTAIGNTWAFAPERLKPTADMELASGLNRFVIHTSVHQPVNDKIPGLGLGPFGQWFTRHETWAEQALPWTTYLARSSYMLQQGKFAADILYYYGEDNNITALFGEKLPDIPEGYNYDFINSDALLNLLSVENGNIVTPSGMSYRILALDPNSRHMTLSVLNKIKSLVEAGAVVVGPKPVDSPSLSDNQADFQTLVNQLWQKDTGENISGKGKIITGENINQVMSDLKVIPDFTYTKPDNNTELLFVHRVLPKMDIYWINNRRDQAVNLDAFFRVTGRAAEIWNPETGDITPASYMISADKTTVPLKLKPSDAIFVVFRKNTSKTSFTVPGIAENDLGEITGSWDVTFQPGRGAPGLATFNTLTSWSDNSDPGIKYFSGTGIYKKIFKAPDEWFKKDQKLIIDLGVVKNLAEVIVNGKSIGIVWKKPFCVDITEALRPGDNVLDVRVTNLWVNRLIGDQQPGVENKITYTTQAFYRADSPLLPSGLLGPVRVLSQSSE